MDHFDRHQVLCDEQHGFRVKRSCESQLLITIDDIARNMEEGDQTNIILLDFAKAFDKFPHDRLGFARSFDSESMLLITKDLVAIEVVHDGTMDNVLQ
jgi:hypothetical protein